MGFWLFYFMENEVEIWKDINGYEGIYRISSLGRVFSVRNNIVLSKCYDKDGYVSYPLNLDGKCKRAKAHHLVITAFIDQNFKTGNGYVSDHINRIRDDNRVENLRIVTYRESISNRGLKNKTGVTNSKGYFYANIDYNKKTYYLGQFYTEKEAHDKYIEATLAVLSDSFDFEKIRVRRRIDSSKFAGVHFSNTHKKWIGRAKIGTRRSYIGLFNTEHEANSEILKVEKELKEKVK